MCKQVIIYGLGPFAELMHYYFEFDGNCRIAGFCADKEYITRETLCDKPVRPFESVAETWPPDSHEMFVAIGYKRMRNRKMMFDKAKEREYRLANYISRRSIVYDNLELGENNVVMPHVHIEPFCRIGDNNIFWSDTLLGHNLTVGSHNYFSAKCILAGDAVIGDLCFVGNGAVLINKIDIGSESYILPGAVIMKSTKEAGMYMGNPAKCVGQHKEEGIVIRRG